MFGYHYVFQSPHHAPKSHSHGLNTSEKLLRTDQLTLDNSKYNASRSTTKNGLIHKNQDGVSLEINT